MNNEIILHITDPESIEGTVLFENNFSYTNFFTIKMLNGYKLQFYGDAYSEDDVLHVNVECFRED